MVLLRKKTGHDASEVAAAMGEARLSANSKVDRVMVRLVWWVVTLTISTVDAPCNLVRCCAEASSNPW